MSLNLEVICAAVGSSNFDLNTSYPLMFLDRIFELCLQVMQGIVTLIPDLMSEAWSIVTMPLL